MDERIVLDLLRFADPFSPMAANVFVKPVNRILQLTFPNLYAARCRHKLRRIVAGGTCRLPPVRAKMAALARITQICVARHSAYRLP